MNTQSSTISNQIRATFLVALSGILYGFMGFFGTKLFNENLSISNMLFWRFFIAMLWILVVSIKPLIHIIKNDNPQSNTLVKTILLGTLTYSGGSGFYFLACQYLGTGMAMVVFFCYPVFVVLFSWVFSNWRMNRHAFISLVAILTGIILLKGHGAYSLSVAGLGFAALAGLSYSMYVYSSRHNSKKIDPRLLTLLICLGNSLLFLIIALKTNSFSVPNTVHAWVYLCALGIFVTAVPIQLLLEGMKFVSPIKASILSVLEPVVTVVVGALMLAESMSIMQFFGVVIVLIGAIFIQFERQHSH